MKRTFMLVGLGNLGSVILELLAREEGLGKIVVASRSEERGVSRVNLARLGAIAQGSYPVIRFVRLDIDDADSVVAAVQREKPDVILSTVTRQSWWVLDLLPPAEAARLKQARFGPWLPLHLAPTLQLMKALRAAGYSGITLTAPYPDVVNAVLACLGLAPTCGLGNLDEIVPKLRLMAAERLRGAVSDVRVWLVAHHALEPAVYGDPTRPVPPCFVRIEHNGRDVTEEVRADELLLAPYALPGGPVTHFLTAGSAVRLVKALGSDSETFLHAPAPGGLPGGYPIVASRAGVRPAAIPGLTLAEAVRINERSHGFDGIDRIDTDGTVVFRPEAAAVLRETLGYNCQRLPPSDIEGRAVELADRFRAYARRCGARWVEGSNG